MKLKGTLRTELICLKCNHTFKRCIAPGTVAVKCPKCSGYDTDIK